MNEENTDAPRVTRARSRRLSTLDTDSRPSTPMLDVTADRASPRPMRKTRLNSATIELRTPTRATRLSVARGDTPEPATPTFALSSAKRATRTPAKSVRKQLPLQEDINEETSNNSISDETNNNKKKVVRDTSELSSAVTTKEAPTRSETPDNVTTTDRMEAEFVTPPDKRRVTRSMSKTPELKRTPSNSPRKQLNMNNSSELKQKQSSETIEIVDSSIEEQKSTHDDGGLIEESISTSNMGKKSEEATLTKVKVIIKDILVESQDLKKPALAVPIDLKNSTTVDINLSDTKEKSFQDEKCASLSIDTTEKSNSAEIKSQLEDQSDHIKSVGFTSHSEAEDDDKPKYPKTPARVNILMHDIPCVVETNPKTKVETPIKPIIVLKGRQSSTPLAKEEKNVLTEENISNQPQQPPLQIDVIKPLSTLKDKPQEAKEYMQKTMSISISEDEEDNESEEEREDTVCSFSYDKVKVFEIYHSGDSMDSSERREIEENEIPHDGESVGSQDTTDEHSVDSANENMSFIVSDNYDDDDIESLCFSFGSKDEEIDAMEYKKRRRIIVHDSSDEEVVQEIKIDKKTCVEDPEEEDEQTKMETEVEYKDENEEISHVSSTTTTVKRLELSAREKSPEAKPEISDRLNKTEPPLVNIDPQENETLKFEEEPLAFEKSMYEPSEKNVSRNKKSIFNECDSNEESIEKNKEAVDDYETVEEPQSINKSVHLNKSYASDDVTQEQSEDTVQKSQSIISDHEKIAPESVVESSSILSNKALELQDKHNQEEETALLAELSSCDLSHLQQMFNPLQKARRQTLFVQKPQLADEELKPKLKRRSVQLSSDFKPSQSFIESLAEEKRERTKRKRLSKSFCSATDSMDISVLDEVESKKIKQSCDEATANDNKIDETAEAGKEIPEMPVVDTLQLQSVDVQPKPTNFSTTDPIDPNFYPSYCDDLINVANDAKFEEKKQRIALAKVPKRHMRLTTNTACIADTVGTAQVDAGTDKFKGTKLKKNVKRLQATKLAVKHAIQLLDPGTANKESKSISRKLSPQPEVNTKPGKVKRQVKKKKNFMNTQVSPVKSSDEENHHDPILIKTTAGYVKVKLNREEKQFKTIITSSSIVKVEPCTPVHKYFKEVPLTPQSNSGFKEMPATPKSSKKKQMSARNPATEAALRFKREIYGRNYK